MAAADPISVFTKDLGSSNRTQREQAFEKTKLLLQNLAGADAELRCLQLWKGLYYSLWMADRPKPQQDLAERLAGLTTVVPPSQRAAFLTAFWQIMILEWTKIDSFRMNKFLYLVRCILRTTFQLSLPLEPSAPSPPPSSTDESPLYPLVYLLADLPLEPTDNRKPNGLRMHVLDIYVDELDRVDTHRHFHKTTVLAPISTLASDSPTKVIRQRAKDTLADERLAAWD